MPGTAEIIRKLEARLAQLRFFPLVAAALVVALASNAAGLAPQYMVRTWQSDDGLPANSVSSVAQTRDGYIWLGTEEGLVRFDGARFTVFDRDSAPELEGSPIRSIAPARDGGLWVFTGSGALFRYHAGRWLKAASLPGGRSTAPVPLWEDEHGTLWAGTEGRGLARVEKGQTVFMGGDAGLPHETVRALCPGASGELWAGTAGGLALLRAGRVEQVLTERDGLADRDVISLARAQDGALWIGTRRGGVYRYVAGVIVRVATLPSNALALAVDPSGVLWAGTNGAGLVRIVAGSVQIATGLDSMSRAIVQTLVLDREGGLWAGGPGHGVSRIARRKVEVLSVRDGLSSEVVLPVFEDASGAIWLGTAGGGLNVLRGGRIAHYSKREGLSAEVIFALAEDREGRLLVGTPAGLDRFASGRFAPFPLRNGSLSVAVSVVLQGRAGEIWVGTHGSGLARIAQGAITWVTAKTGLPSDRIACLLEGRGGDLYVGTHGGGVAVVANGAVRRLPGRLGLPGEEVLCLDEDADGALWAGTVGRGLARLKDGEVYFFGRRQGLLDESVFAIVEDGDLLWMSCNKGIFAARKSALNAVARGSQPTVSIVAFGKTDGMDTRECNGGVWPSACRRRDGTLWFPTMRGVAIVNPALAIGAPTHVAAVVERVEVDGVSLMPGGGAAVLPPGFRRLEAWFTAPSFSDPENLRFRAELDGFDREWVDTGARRNVAYTNLRAGTYTLRVAAAASSGSLPGTVATFAFRVEPHFYETVVFYVGCLAAGVFAVVGLGLARRRRILGLEYRVAQRTAELTAANKELEAFTYSVSHDLRAPLRAVDGYTGILLEDYASSLDAEGQRVCSVIRQSARDMGTLIDNLLAFSRIGRAAMQPVTLDMADMAQSLFFEATTPEDRERIDFYVGPLPSVVADPALIRQVWTNLLSNAVKFSSKKERAVIEVNADQHGGEIIFSIRDNGAGFEMRHADKLFGVFKRLHRAEEFEGTGVGLAIVERIVQRHGGRVWAEGEPGKGATFHFSFTRRASEAYGS